MLDLRLNAQLIYKNARFVVKSGHIDDT